MTDQLYDCEGITLESNKPFAFSCCDCGLTHHMVIVSEDGKPVGFAVKRIPPVRVPGPSADQPGTWVNIGAGLAEHVQQGEKCSATVKAEQEDAAAAPAVGILAATPGCNCPGAGKLQSELHAPNCPYRAALSRDRLPVGWNVAVGMARESGPHRDLPVQAAVILKVDALLAAGVPVVGPLVATPEGDRGPSPRRCTCGSESPRPFNHALSCPQSLPAGAELLTAKPPEPPND